MPSPWPQSPPTPAQRSAYADAVPKSFWLDTLPERPLHAPLDESVDAELCATDLLGQAEHGPT